MNAWLVQNSGWIQRTAWALGEWSLRAFVILIVAWVMTALLRNGSAAVRHAVWVAAVAGVAALPILNEVLPGWGILPKQNEPVPVIDQGPNLSTRIVSPPDASSANATVGVPSPVTVKPSVEEKAVVPAKATLISAAVLVVWLGISAALFGRLFFALRRLSSIEDASFEYEPWTKTLTRMANEAGLSKTPRLVFSQAELMPMTWGWLHARIILPRSAKNWSEREIATVLKHELGHIRRSDWATKIFVEIATCLGWFHPLMWLARRQLAIEQEKACDEWVLAKGNSAADYAETLVSLATRLAKGNTGCVGAALGWNGKLEARVRAIITGGARRHKHARKKALAMACIVMGMAASIAAVTSAQPQPGSSLVGVWIGANDSEGIWDFKKNGTYTAIFNGAKANEDGTWKFHENTVVLNNDKQRRIEQLQPASLLWAYEDDGKVRKESFRRRVNLDPRTLNANEKALAGNWTGTRGFIPATLHFKEDGSFASGSILAGPPISEGTWRMENAALDLVTLSDHDAERVGKTNRYAVLELDQEKLLILNRDTRDERLYLRQKSALPSNGQGAAPGAIPTGEKETGEIRGTVWEGPKPLEGAEIILEKYEPKDDFRYQNKILTKADGTFSVSGLPPGKYRVSRLFTWEAKTDKGTSSISTGTHSTLAELRPGAVTEVKIGGTGRPIKGQLVPHVDLPRVAFTASDFRFLTHNDGPNQHGGRHIILDIKDDGTFTAMDVPPGEYKLYVGIKAAHEGLDAPDIATFSKTVVVPDGHGVFDLGFINHD